jgi:hypothetical protein
MTQALTLTANGIDGIKYHTLFKFFVSQYWGFISNLDIKGDIAYINLVNWENKFPKEVDTLSLKYKDKNITVSKINWSPRKKWSSRQFSCLTSFIEVGR